MFRNTLKKGLDMKKKLLWSFFIFIYKREVFITNDSDTSKPFVSNSVFFAISSPC